LIKKPAGQDHIDNFAIGTLHLLISNEFCPHPDLFQERTLYGSRINKYHVCRYFKETETDLSVDEFWAVIDS